MKMKMYRHVNVERILKSCLDCPYCVPFHNGDGEQCYTCIAIKEWPKVPHPSTWEHKNFNGFLPDCHYEDAPEVGDEAVPAWH